MFLITAASGSTRSRPLGYFDLTLRNSSVVKVKGTTMEGDQYCPFCDGETEESLKEHGKICPDYQETVSQNICPFCATQIDECYVEQHFKYREVMKISKCPFCFEETTEDLSDHGKICLEYQETLVQNICKFCQDGRQIDDCMVIKHQNYREKMEPLEENDGDDEGEDEDDDDDVTFCDEIPQQPVGENLFSKPIHENDGDDIIPLGIVVKNSPGNFDYDMMHT